MKDEVEFHDLVVAQRDRSELAEEKQKIYGIGLVVVPSAQHKSKMNDPELNV